MQMYKYILSIQVSNDFIPQIKKIIPQIKFFIPQIIFRKTVLRFTREEGVSTKSLTHPQKIVYRISSYTSVCF